MKTIYVSYRRDGDVLEIGESPWPRVAIDKLASFYQPYWGWDYRWWSKVIDWCGRKERALVAVPVAHGCDVAGKLWGSSCWHKEGETS